MNREEMIRKVKVYLAEYLSWDRVNEYDEIIKTLESSIHIPSNATNGDVIKAILNPYKICEYEYSVHVYMTEKDFWKAEYQMNFDTSWWNAPYREGDAE